MRSNYEQLVKEESTRTVMAELRKVIEGQGLFCALYSEWSSHFFVTPKACENVDTHCLTQVGRAMKGLGVQMIPATRRKPGADPSVASEPGGTTSASGWPQSIQSKAPKCCCAHAISMSSTKHLPSRPKRTPKLS